MGGHVTPLSSLSEGGTGMVPSVASSLAAAAGASVGGVVLVILIVAMVTVAVVVVKQKGKKRWKSVASNGVTRGNEYPLSNPVYSGELDHYISL